MYKPRQSWADYLAEFPKGKSPSAEDMFLRWDELETVPPDPRFPERGHSRRRKYVGERNLYQAWLAEAIDDQDEAHYFQHKILTTVRLVELAIVPAVRFSSGFLIREVQSLQETVEVLQSQLDGIRATLKNAGLEVIEK